MSSYRDLIVWRTSMDLVDAIDETVSPFPMVERFGLGGPNALETQIIIGARRHYIDEIRAEKLLTSCAEIGRLINGLIRDFQRRSSS